MSDSRRNDHGPERVPSYGHKFGALHDQIVGDKTLDQSYPSLQVSNLTKVEYICKALRLDPRLFNLDLPLPMEDWAHSEDFSLHRSGLFFSDLRNQFYNTLLQQEPDLERSEAWRHKAEAEFWMVEFNKLIAKRRDGLLIPEWRVLH